MSEIAYVAVCSVCRRFGFRIFTFGFYFCLIIFRTLQFLELSLMVDALVWDIVPKRFVQGEATSVSWVLVVCVV